MNDLIRIEQKNGIETVNARELHAFLGVSSRFNDWISNRIKKYNFVDGEDFTIVTKRLVTEGSHYHITIDMAKELSMVENNTKGREARQYFIACEKKSKEQNRLSIPKSYAEALRLAADQAEQIEELKPKAELADACIRDESTHYSITDAGKHLGIRQSEMFSIMRSNYLLTQKSLPTQKALDYGVLIVRTNEVNGKNRKQSVMTMACINEFNRRYVSKGVM